ncbi:GNAT family acetyltransferase [Tamlana nanhaiensis]|uniref:GNAT family acetyltransferase n=1 Tax=Neotamlana nanhaiensis TaxID=1382798 RepID=A0A0D7W6B1_9FLAO|nr:GNAT family N-acetyltransferase [Tamlana nanhaiensis]KJD34660.1 GNAT family acetyltransferase [Tamlana nanhaiensis]
MIKVVRTNSSNSDFIKLVKQLDNYLSVVDGDEHDFYNQFNKIDALNHCVIAYKENKPVGCGAFKPFDNNTVEIKRMFTLPETRNSGIASIILKTLEDWATEQNYNAAILETGKRQTEAVNFYTKNNYYTIPNYGQYIGVDNSICFKKDFAKKEN